MTEDDIDHAPEPQEFKADADGLRSAAKELVQSREETLDRKDLEPDPATLPTFASQDNPGPIDEVVNIDPETGKPLPDDVTKTLKEQSRSLAEYHRAQEQARAAEVAARQPEPIEQPQPVATDSLPAAATEQPVEQPAQQVDPVAAEELQRAGAYLANLAAAERGRHDELVRLRGTFPEYAAATNTAQIAELARRDPQRHAQYLLANQRAAAIGQELAQINSLKQTTVREAAETQRQYEHQQYSAWINQQNDLVDRAIPNETEREALSREVGAMLKEVGITKDMIDRPEYRMLRSAQGQMFLAQSARLRIAERARAAKPKSLSQNLKPTPPVVRPGTSTFGDRQLDNIDALSARLDRASNTTQGAKIGAALLKEMRRAR